MGPVQKTIAKWLLAFALVGGILWWRWGALSEAFVKLRAGLDPDHIFYAFGMAAGAYLFGLMCTFVRWWLLVRAQGLPFRLIDAARLNFASLFFSIFLPGSIGGDLIKAGLLAQEQERRTIAIATIIVDRVVGLYGLFLLTSITGLILWGRLEVEVLRLILLCIGGIALGVPLFVLFVMLLPFDAMKWVAKLRTGGRIRRVMAEVFYAFHMYRQKIHYVFAAVGLATIGHIGFVWSFYFSSQALPPPVPPAAEQAILIPVYRVIQSVPFVPGGIGQNELAGETLYSFVEPDPARPIYAGQGTLAVLAGRMVDYSMAFLGLFFYLPLRATVRKVIHEGNAPPSLNGEPAGTGTSVVKSLPTPKDGGG